MLSPPYIGMDRPTFSNAPANVLYGKSYTLKVTLPKGTKKVQAALLDVGYSTHGVHMSQRWVELDAELKLGNQLVITGPANTGLYPPGTSAPRFCFGETEAYSPLIYQVPVGSSCSPTLSRRL